MFQIIALIVLTLTSILANAQSVVTGKIKDGKGKPVPGASIAIKDSYDGGTSDSTGNFRFRTAEKGDQIILITSI
jgi:hypothetical protein